ncbi:MAG TPA: cytochrome d ubiquinol oxidase subunit II [Candidatus Dormibacteraeota bacterium]|jgi:cytochrome d ubiquinol oxidase subunit II|nr:cytochrome d ubiquinol oxidase subunit II [Candidatus Dormibacteraeota bacterium]
MSHVALVNLWFFLIAFFWLGYFFLEGFDFGVGMLLPFLARDDVERRVLINSIGPHWDGNEVWLVVAGGATFAAFPGWYATLLSGFYLPLFVILVALILRAVAFEFRGKHDRARWRRWWDRALFWGSAVPSFLWGMAFADVLHGVPIGAGGEFSGSVVDLLQPYGLLGGLAFLLLFGLHGAAFLSLKTTGELAERSRVAGERIWLAALVANFAFLAWSYERAVTTNHAGLVPGPVPLASLGAVLATGWLLRERRLGWSFVATAAAIVLLVTTIFLNLYPRVMVSSLGPTYDLTISNTASSAYTLGVMSVIAAVFAPLVLLYQGWTYWVFRRRIGREDLAEGY